MYDVFISYNRQDQEAVESVAHALRDVGVNPFVDRWYLKSGQSWVGDLEKALGDCGAVAIFVGPDGLGQWQQREKNFALDRQALEPEFPVIPVLLPGGDPALGFLKLNTWVDLRNGITAESIEMLVCAIRRQVAGPDLRKRVAEAMAAICPYRGLLPFREEDEPFFCGRQAFTDKLAAEVAERNLVAVVGASGSGKSSVVYAGLVPRLRRGAKRGGAGSHVWEMVTVLPQDRPIHALAERFLSLLEPDIDQIEWLSKKKRLAEGLMSGEIELRDVVERAIAKQPGTDRLLLIVDQWEELYTLCQEQPERQQFIDQILTATSSRKLTVVLTLRGDFYGYALSNRRLSDRLQGGVVNIAPMTEDELRKAIVEPAEKVSLRFEDGLVGRILEDVGEAPGRLPLLEFLLAELWEKRRGNVLEHDIYTAIGGVSGAIAKRAEASFERLQSQEKDQLHWAMVRLVAPGQDAEDTRRRAALTELDPEARGVIAKLANDRLLVTTLDADGREIVEVSHEALIREWPRLKDWVNESRQNLRILARLEDQASVWQAGGRDCGDLLPAGRRLVEGEELLRTMPRAIGPLVKAYVEASTAQDEARRKKEHEAEIAALQQRARNERDKAVRNRIFAAAATVLLMIASGAAYYGFEQARLAGHQAAIAAKHAADARHQKEVAEKQTAYANEQAEKANAHFTLALGATTKVLDRVRENLNNGFISTKVSAVLLEVAETTLNKLYSSAPNAEAAKAQIELLFASSDVFSKLGKLDEANDRAVKAGNLAKKQYEADPSNPGWVRALYNGHYRQGDNLAALGRLTESLQAYQAALHYATRIAEAHPSPRAQFNLSFVNNKIGDIAKIRGENTVALHQYEASLRIIEKVNENDPNKPEWLRQLAATHMWVGDALTALGRADDSIEHYWTAQRIRQKLSAGEPSHAGLRSNLATSHSRLGDAYAARGDFDGALLHHRKSHELRRQNVDQDQTNMDSLSQLAYSHVYIGDLFKIKPDTKAALAEYEWALDIRRRLAGTQKANVQWQENVAVTLVRIGDALLTGDPAAAIEKYRESLAILEPLAKSNKDSVAIPRNVFISRTLIADALVAQGKKNEAVDEYRAALAAIRPVVAIASSMTGPAWRLSVPSAHNKLAAALKAVDDPLGALEEYRIVQRMVREHADRIPASTRLKDAAESHRGMALVFAALRRMEDASRELASAHEIFKQLAAKDPHNRELARAADETSGTTLIKGLANDESRPVLLPSARP